MGELLMREASVPHRVTPRSDRRGDGGAEFEEFFRREFVSLASLGTAITGDRCEGEDVAQVALSRAHRDWDRVSRYDNPGTWVRRVTINLALSARRRAAVGTRATLRLAGSRSETEPEWVEADPELWAAVARLPRQQRAAVALHYLEDRPVAELAELMGCSASTARVHLHRGRSAIARALEVQS